MSLRTEFEPFFLGVDGGGTSCRTRLCNMAGVESGVGVAGSANTTLGVDAAFHKIVIAIKMAVLDAGLIDQCFGRIYAGLGLAGLSLRRDYEAVNSYHHPFAELSAETDAYIACLGAHQGQDGGVLIIGTGSCGLLIMGNSSVAVGGWGYLMSDLGSGAQLGRSALRGALEECDALLPKSGLGTALMAHFDENPESLVTWSETATPKFYGSFVPEIISHAINKDEAAIALVNSIANDIERMIFTLVSKGAAKIALIGGLAEPMLPWLSETVLGYLTKAKGDPLDGALMLARQKYKLVEEGLLSQRQGAGTFVSSRVEQLLTELTGYREDMAAWGMAPDVHGEHNLPVVQNINLISAPITMIQFFYLFAKSLSLARGMNPNAPEHLLKVAETT